MMHRVFLIGVVSLGLLCPPSFAQESDMAVGLSDRQLEALGRQWVAAINERDVPALAALLDLQALGFRSSKTFSDDETERNEFVGGFTSRGDRLPVAWISQIEAQQGRARFLRVRSFGGMRGPLVRYDLGESGHNYLLLIAENRSGGEPRVVDVFLATTGQQLSDTVGAATQLVIAPSDSLLGRLFGLQAMDRNLTAMFKKLGQDQLAGRVADAYDTVRQLPDEIRNERLMLTISVQLASQLNEDLYREELARVARYYGDDETLAFVLVDHYFYENDTQSAMAGVARMEATFGIDAAISNIKANLAVQAGDLRGARRYAEQGIEQEPDNEESHWTLLTVLIMAKEHAAGVKVLENLGQNFGYELNESSFVDNELYADFVRSPEYRRWLGAR